MKKPKLNKKLIRKIIKHITDEPNRYLQSEVIVTGKPGDFVHGYDSYDGQKLVSCGTAACIGGWAYILNRKRPKLHAYDILDPARHDLGLSLERANVLFSGEPSLEWPPPYNKQWAAARTPKARAKVAAALLTKVNDTNGTILDYGVWAELG